MARSLAATSSDASFTGPVLEAVKVTKHFAVNERRGRESVVRAVENASLRLDRGKIVALVGESGSGKTTLARLLAGFYPPTAGQILLHGVPVGPGRRAEREHRQYVQLIFQDPFASLNPVHRVRYTLNRALRIHGDKPTSERLTELLERVNLSPARDFLEKFPHELSGGQRQRIVIARALAVEPRVLLADEPTSMLDVSIRLDILNLLRGLREREGLSLLYVTHDIATAMYLADTIHVLYAGQIIESGPSEAVIADPQHPYTKLLMACAPDPGRRANPKANEGHGNAPAVIGEPPSLVRPPKGCRFHPRCPHAMTECRESFPPRTEFGQGHWAHCWLYEQGSAGRTRLKMHPTTFPNADSAASLETGGLRAIER